MEPVLLGALVFLPGAFFVLFSSVAVATRSNFFRSTSEFLIPYRSDPRRVMTSCQRHRRNRKLVRLLPGFKENPRDAHIPTCVAGQNYKRSRKSHIVPELASYSRRVTSS